MKRSIAAVATALGLVTFLPVQSLARAALPEEVQEYSTPNAVGPDTNIPGVLLHIVEFEPQGAKVRLAVEDDVSSNVLVEVRQNENKVTSFCTKTDTPLRINRRATLQVYLYAGPCAGKPSFLTRGVVRAWFPAPRR